MTGISTGSTAGFCAAAGSRGGTTVTLVGASKFRGSWVVNANRSRWMWTATSTSAAPKAAELSAKIGFVCAMIEPLRAGCCFGHASPYRSSLVQVDVLDRGRVIDVLAADQR